MAFPRKRRDAFTLTEMLMAAGILGIGLTMVASIFPVAVDQSRRSRDQTMAALCARSVSAMLRANRTKTLNWLNATSTMSVQEGGVPVDRFPNKLRVYKPTTFLYTNSRSYSDAQAWGGGNYIARIFTKRIAPDGPYRITIVVIRSSGEDPTSITAPPTSYWYWNFVKYPLPIPKSGDYVLHRGSGDGMGDLLDYVKYDPALTAPANKTGYFAVGTSSAGWPFVNYSSNSFMYIPNAVAAYHMILGN